MTRVFRDSAVRLGIERMAVGRIRDLSGICVIEADPGQDP